MLLMVRLIPARPSSPQAPQVKKGFLLEAEKKEKARAEKRAATQSAVAKADADTRQVPEYHVTKNDTVKVVVNLPLISSMKNVDLDVSTNKLRLSSPEYKDLDCKLPCDVDASKTKASFKKSTKELVVTIAIA